ncbi:MAG: transglutaminase domain-containing protein [Zavarzinella sp.]|nr:transglutaminase domain-containing protein [Zavarzinella sp.]
MAPEMPRVVRRVTFLLLALSAGAVEVAAVDTRALRESLGLAAAWVVIAGGVGRFVPVPADPRRKPPLWVFLLLLALAAAPFAVEPLRRKWTGDGYPLELQMVFGLRNVGLGLAACGGWFLCMRLACVVSLFLTLFATAMTNHPAVLVILGLYTATGSAWLLLVYWTGLKAVFVAPEKAVAVEVQPGREGLPWVALCLLALAVGGGLALALIGPKRAAFALGELMPTSGGTGETDPFARYGVGDGPEETAGDDARAAGMVETDKTIEDNKNSLIDAVSDMYGPPHKPPKEQERMVAAGNVDVIQFRGKPPDNRRPSRDFDTSRKGPKGDKKPSSRDARGLFEIEGRTPLHVRLVAYDRYDAANMRWIEARKPGSKLIEAEGGDWMRLGHLKPSADWYREDERHKLKAADMNDNLVPTPALLTRFRINKVDKPDYYEWDYEGVLALAGRKRTPPGVIVTTDCRTLDPSRIPEAAFGRIGQNGGTAPELGDVPDDVRPVIDRLAREWAGDCQRGWPQIEAVVTKLRTDYTFDPSAAAPPEHPAPAVWFLTESRRGPDYLFATAAALLLRSLDYPTRVCLGYYASPDAYDPETAHTPVRKTDLHTWAEVRLQDGHWMVVEPTPGYEVLGPKLPLVERIVRALGAVAAWAWRHVVELVLTVAVLVVVWARRRELLDAIAVRLWRWRPGRTWREQVRRAVRVLERRGRWAGRPRPERQTTPAWLRGVQPKAADQDPDFVRFTRMAEWAAYALDVPPPWSESEVMVVCRRVLDGWPLRRWRDAVIPDPAIGA